MSLYIILKNNSKKIRLLGGEKKIIFTLMTEQARSHKHTHALLTSFVVCNPQVITQADALWAPLFVSVCLFVYIPLVLVAMSATFWKASRKAPVIAMVVLRQNKHKDTHFSATSQQHNVHTFPTAQADRTGLCLYQNTRGTNGASQMLADLLRNQATEYLLSN